MLGFKQQAILEEFKKRKHLTAEQVSRFYGGNEKHTLNAFQTLEIKGYIRFKGNGIWKIENLKEAIG